MNHDDNIKLRIRRIAESSDLRGVVPFALAALLLSGCVTSSGKLPSDHGGGVGLLNNGDLVSIKRDGSLGANCLACRAGERIDDCTRRAEERKTAVCSTPADDAMKSDALSLPQPTSSSARQAKGVQLAAARAVPVLARGGLTCWGRNSARGIWEPVVPPTSNCTEHHPPKVLIPYCTCPDH